MTDEPWGTWGAYQTAASNLLAALKAAVASPANMAVRTTDVHRNAVAAIAQAEAAGITTKAAEEVAWNRVL